MKITLYTLMLSVLFIGCSDDESSSTTTIEAVPQFPRLQLTLMFATFLPLLIANLAKNRWTECGSSGFWLLTIGSIVYNLTVAFLYRKHLATLNQKISVGEADSELIPFKWNEKFPINSLHLMRGYLIIDQYKKNKFIDVCFDAYWKDNLDISDEEIVENII